MLVAGPHAARWSKGRRFQAAWSLIRAIGPSTSLPLTSLPLAQAAEAYSLLDRGAAAIALLTYGEEGARREPLQQRSRF